MQITLPVHPKAKPAVGMTFPMTIVKENQSLSSENTTG